MTDTLHEKQRAEVSALWATCYSRPLSFAIRLRKCHPWKLKWKPKPSPSGLSRLLGLQIPCSDLVSPIGAYNRGEIASGPTPPRSDHGLTHEAATPRNSSACVQTRPTIRPDRR